MTNSTSITFTKPFKACDADLDLITYPIMVFPKIDGVRGLCRNAKLLGRSLKAHKNLYTKAVYSDAVYEGLDGELAIANEETSQSLCRDTTSATGTILGSPELEWHCFDLLTEGTINLPYLERYTALQALTLTLPHHVTTISFTWCTTKEEVLSMYDSCIAAGYEGIVLRDPEAMHKNGRSTKNQAGYLRLKPKGDAEGIFHHFDEAMHNGNVAKKNALGETERSSHKANKTGLGMIGALWLTPIGGGEPFKVGPGCMTHRERTYFFNHPIEIDGRIIKFQFFDHGAKDKYRHARFHSFRNESDMEC